MKTYYSFAKDALSKPMAPSPLSFRPYEILQADPDKNPALVGGDAALCGNYLIHKT